MTAIGKLLRSTAFKISLVYLLMTAVGTGLVLGRVGWNVTHLIDAQIRQTVDADITGLAEQYSDGGIAQLVTAIERRSRQPGAELYLVTTNAGEPIVGNVASLPEGVLSKPGLVITDYLRAGETTAHHRAVARIFLLPGGFRLLVGHDIEEGVRLRRIFVGALITSLIWLVIIGAVGGLWIARRVLHRVDTINDKARAIVGGDLSARLPLAGTGDELDRLVENLNSMLDRISLLAIGLREVSDNIAHDLKTPLTRLRSRAEEALRFAQSPEEYRAALEKVIEESDSLIRIFNALLMITRAEAGAGPENLVDFDAADVARDVGELYEPAAEDRGLSLAVSTEPGLMLYGSRELIGQALANLVDNALKYGAPLGATPAEASVGISAKRQGGMIEISVADHGPGIAPNDRERVQERFVRLENSRSRPGSGLGLALAAAVARLHKGTLRFEDNAPGLKAVLSLPAAAALPPKLAPPAPRGEAA
ncbi:MAG: ATP-binding protein [Methylovirgula sp.]